MKRCDFCGFCGRTEKDEQVCTKRLLYVGDLEKDYPCSDFSVRIDSKAILVALIAGIAALTILTLIIS